MTILGWRVSIDVYSKLVTVNLGSRLMGIQCKLLSLSSKIFIVSVEKYDHLKATI